ncbi:hypothetical protein CR513_58187, partial [Mucuna pruriens]
MNAFNKPSSTYSLAMNDKDSKFLSFKVSNTMPKDLWIVDFDANNHMTAYSSYYLIYSTLLANTLLLLMVRTIGVAKEQVRLYYLQSMSMKASAQQDMSPSMSSMAKGGLWQRYHGQ